jgi:hypothetical protein
MSVRSVFLASTVSLVAVAGIALAQNVPSQVNTNAAANTNLIPGLVSDVAALKKEIADLKKEVADLKAQNATQNQQLVALRNADQQMASHGAAIAKLQNQLANHTHSLGLDYIPVDYLYTLSGGHKNNVMLDNKSKLFIVGWPENKINEKPVSGKANLPQ